MYFNYRRFERFEVYLSMAAFTLLGLGVALFMFNFKTYDQVLYNETKEWN